MISHYLSIAFRNLGRDKAFALINITGLAVGITCFLTLFLFIQDELSFDKNVTTYPSDQVYRIFVRSYISGENVVNSKTAAPLGPLLKQRFPEVITYARIGYHGPRTFIHREKSIRSGSIYAVDSTFFKIFNLSFVEGNPSSALTRPNSLVITESAAARIFGSENPVGKSLITDAGETLLVTGVVRDFPRTSHFRCDYLESLSSYEVSDRWLNLWYSTYIVLQRGTDSKVFEKKLEKVVVDQVGPEAQNLLGVPIQQFLASGNTYGFFIQPFSSIYLHSSRNYNIDPNTEWSNVNTSDIVYTHMFGIIAAFILLLAIINFMNLATAKSERRSREVGIRKTLGSFRVQIALQFIGEAILMSTAAMFMALGMLSAVLPLFNNLVERDLDFVLYNKMYTVPILAGFVIIVGTLAGSYPAFYLSSFKPAKVLKAGGSGYKPRFRSGLVILQFAISICLLIGTLVIRQQISFIQHKNLGFNKDHLLSINNASVLGDHMDAFRTTLLQNTHILSTTFVSRLLGTGIPGTAYLYNKQSGTDPLPCQYVDVDYDFLSTFQIQLKSGRLFSKEFPSDESAVILNEAAVNAFFADDPLNKYLVSLDIRDTGRKYKIIGVVSDFNYESLHAPIRPLVLHLRSPRQPASSLTLRIASDEVSGTLHFVESVWKKLVDNETISYSFVDQTLARLYLAEEKIELISLIFSILAIFIACIGFYGLAAFVTEQRTREIGIRKVLGASSIKIVRMLLKEFAGWVLVSNLIAWPVAFLVMNNWLRNFAFRISIDLVPFVAAGTATILIASTTVAFHVLRASIVNPVESLKHE